MTLSIIIPVYNGELTVTRAVESVLASSVYADGKTEVVIVDDGSTDGTARMTDDLAERHHGVRVIHTPNRGVSAARNRGIAEASHRLLAFLDADDYVAPDYHARAIVPLIERPDCDLCVTGYTKVTAGAETATAPQPSLLERTDLPHRLVPIAQQGVINSPTNKIYRADVICRHGVAFEAGRAVAEDLFFNLDYLAVCGDVALVDAAGNYYIQHAASVTNERAARYDHALELEENMAYRATIRAKLSRIGVPDSAIEAYFRGLDQVWFRTLIKNVSAPGTPHSHREQIRRVRAIMRHEPVRSNVLADTSRTRLALLNHVLYRLNSATLARAAYRVL